MAHEEYRVNKAGKSKRLEPSVEDVSYYGMLDAFSKAGCLKLQHALDNHGALLSRFRAQLKKYKISVEKAYKTFDPMHHGWVQKKDFVQDCLQMGL